MDSPVVGRFQRLSLRWCRSRAITYIARISEHVTYRHALALCCRRARRLSVRSVNDVDGFYRTPSGARTQDPGRTLSPRTRDLHDERSQPTYFETHHALPSTSSAIKVQFACHRELLHAVSAACPPLNSSPRPLAASSPSWVPVCVYEVGPFHYAGQICILGLVRLLVCLRMQSRLVLDILGDSHCTLDTQRHRRHRFQSVRSWQAC